MDILLEAAGVAAKCQAEFVLLCGTGVAAARVGILDEPSLRQFSRLFLTFLNPCIVLQLSQHFTAERVYLWSPVLVAAVVHVAVGALIGRAGAWVTLTQP